MATNNLEVKIATEARRRGHQSGFHHGTGGNGSCVPSGFTRKDSSHGRLPHSKMRASGNDTRKMSSPMNMEQHGTF